MKISPVIQDYNEGNITGARVALALFHEAYGISKLSDFVNELTQLTKGASSIFLCGYDSAVEHYIKDRNI